MIFLQLTGTISIGDFVVSGSDSETQRPWGRLCGKMTSGLLETPGSKTQGFCNIFPMRLNLRRSCQEIGYGRQKYLQYSTQENHGHQQR